VCRRTSAGHRAGRALTTPDGIGAVALCGDLDLIYDTYQSIMTKTHFAFEGERSPGTRLRAVSVAPQAGPRRAEDFRSRLAKRSARRAAGALPFAGRKMGKSRVYREVFRGFAARANVARCRRCRRQSVEPRAMERTRPPELGQTRLDRASGARPTRALGSLDEEIEVRARQDGGAGGAIRKVRLGVEELGLIAPPESPDPRRRRPPSGDATASAFSSGARAAHGWISQGALARIARRRVDRAAFEFASRTNATWILCSRDASPYVDVALDVAVLADCPAGVGPLAIGRAVGARRGSGVITLACDMPFVTGDLLRGSRTRHATLRSWPRGAPRLPLRAIPRALRRRAGRAVLADQLRRAPALFRSSLRVRHRTMALTADERAMWTTGTHRTTCQHGPARDNMTHGKLPTEAASRHTRR